MISQACRPQGGQEGHGTPRFLADQLTLSKPEGAEYVHQITTGTPGFSDLSTAPVTNGVCPMMGLGCVNWCSMEV